MKGTRSRGEWSVLRREYLAKLAERHAIRLQLHDRVWAVTDDGRWVALPGVTATGNPDMWWLRYMRDEFRRRRAVGAILLCASTDQPLLDFGLPAAFITEIESHLSVGNEREQVYFNVLRQRGRFELQLRGGRSVDITRRLGDVSWLREPLEAGAPIAAEANPTYGRSGDGWRAENHKFFARYVDHALHPLDPVDLRVGGIYLVEARAVKAAPRNTALRRIVARGGPPDLPRDLAEQHDHYAHGRLRR